MRISENGKNIMMIFAFGQNGAMRAYGQLTEAEREEAERQLSQALLTTP
jgi:hypothetical protein